MIDAYYMCVCIYIYIYIYTQMEKDRLTTSIGQSKHGRSRMVCFV